MAQEFSDIEYNGIRMDCYMKLVEGKWTMVIFMPSWVQSNVEKSGTSFVKSDTTRTNGIEFVQEIKDES